MNEKNYNGFSSEEEYEEVMGIIKNAIDDYTDTIAIELTTNSVEKYVVVMVETKELNHFAKYFVNDKGVFYVNLESENMPIMECKIFTALNKCTEDVFRVLDCDDRQNALKKFLDGDDTAVSEKVREDAIKHRNDLDWAFHSVELKVEKAKIWNIAQDFGFINREHLTIAPIERHYGVKMYNEGNKYYNFKHRRGYGY